ncbi:MAG: amidohydrolase family protein [Bryobacteraceae bacterium]
MRKLLWLAIAVVLPAQQNRFAPGIGQFVSVTAPVVALLHVRVIDGTGQAPLDDQTVVIEHGRIAALGAAARTEVPAGALRIDLAHDTVIPGIVGMHEHLFYPSGGGIPTYNEQWFSFPRLYLASGVTSARTGGSLEPYTDLSLKRLIDGQRVPGPKLYLTGPYLEGTGAWAPQMHQLKDAADARRTVDYWASEGVTSFKAYMNITHAELEAAVGEAHKLGVKVTGHLCSVGFREAAEIGIDNLEHGLLVDTEFDDGKKRDVCPPQPVTEAAIAKLDMESAPVQETIRELVKRGVAVTSTLAVFEAMTPHRPPFRLEQRLLDALTPQASIAYLESRARAADQTGSIMPALLKNEMRFERDFARAGGLLMAGADPTGNGGAMAGFADQRNAEVLVEAGFTPVEAIRIMSYNGAKWLGALDRAGSVAVGKDADLVVVEGDPAERIADIEKVKIVFKDGIGYDPEKLIRSVAGAVGLH